MCSSQVMRWAQNALCRRARRAVEIGTAIAGGKAKGRRAGGVIVTGWPLWPTGSRSDQVRRDAVLRCVCMWIRRRSYLVVRAAFSPEPGSGTVPRSGAC